MRIPHTSHQTAQLSFNDDGNPFKGIVGDRDALPVERHCVYNCLWLLGRFSKASLGSLRKHKSQHYLDSQPRNKSMALVPYSSWGSFSCCFIFVALAACSPWTKHV
jgi:hypothetical protein